MDRDIYQSQSGQITDDMSEGVTETHRQKQSNCISFNSPQALGLTSSHGDLRD